jgi:hypothetical protein
MKDLALMDASEARSGDLLAEDKWKISMLLEVNRTA